MDLGADVRAMCSELLRRFSTATGQGHFTDAEIWVTADTWQQALDLVDRGSMLIHGRPSGRAPRAPSRST